MTTSRQTIDPLPQFGSYAFLPYVSNQNPIPTSSSSSPTQSDPLTVLSPSSWTYCGPILSPTSPLPPSFHTWSHLTVSSPSLLLSRLHPLLTYLHTFLPTTGVQHYWLTIRATKPTTEYNIPRWHADAQFFDTESPQSTTPTPTTTSSHGPGGFRESGGSQRGWKLATTLLGPSTLFIQENEPALRILRQTKTLEKAKMRNHSCTSIRCIGCSTYSDSLRHSLATHPILSSLPLTSPATGEIAFFRLGDDEGAVHSEPRCEQDRIFVNVVPGTEEGLRGLVGRWGMGFPRAWCFGMRVGGVESDEGGWFEGRGG